MQGAIRLKIREEYSGAIENCMKHKNEAAVLAAACGWGLIGLFTRNLASFGVYSGGVMIIRGVGCTVLIGLIVLLRGGKDFRIRLKDFPLFFAFGVSTLFFTYCYYSAIELVSMSVACTLMFSAPVYVTLLSIPLFHERFEWRKIVSLVMAMGGVVLVSGIADGGVTFNAKGAVFGVLSGLGYSVYNLLSKLLSERGYNCWQINFYGWVVCAAGGILIWGFGSAAPALVNTEGILLCLGIVLISGVMPAILYNWALGRMDASRASMMGTVEPVVATIAGAIVFREMLSIPGMLGILLVLNAVLLLNIRLPKKPDRAADNEVNKVK